VRHPRAVTRVALLGVALGLVCAACTSGPSQSRSSRSPRPSKGSPVAHPVLTKLHQQSGLRFVKNRNGSNPTAIVVLASARNLQPGQQGAALAVRRVGNLIGSCSPGHPAVTVRLTYRGAIVSEVREPITKPIALHLDAPYWPPVPSAVGGEQQFAFFQVSGGGESADFSLALWATLTPVAGGCTFSANGVLRVRCSGLPPSVADPICSYLARRRASTHSG
jgi:hypothetical protein